MLSMDFENNLKYIQLCEWIFYCMHNKKSSKIYFNNINFYQVKKQHFLNCKYTHKYEHLDNQHWNDVKY